MKRKKFIFSTAIAISLFGVHFAYAWIVPGVDEPYDPVDYYSPTSISYADSAPSVFALRELSRGSVLDLTRKVKSTLFDTTFASLLDVIGLRNDSTNINLTSISADQSTKALNKINTVFDSTKDLSKSNIVSDTDDQTVFRTLKTTENPTNTFDEAGQTIWLSTIYQKIMGTAAANNEDVSSRMDELDTAVNLSASSPGDLAANQANTEVQAIQAAELARRNALLANYITAEAAHNMAQEDQRLKAIEQGHDGTAFIVPDPYNQTDKEQTQFSRPKAPGFVDF